MHKLEPIICHVCNLPTGDTWIPDPDVADHRHTACEVLHGSFKEMADDLALCMGGQKAEDFVKIHRKISVVASALKKEPALKDFKGNFNLSAFQDVLEKVRPKMI